MIRKTQLKAHLLLMLRTAEEQTALMQQLLGAVLPSLPAIFKYQFCGCSGRRRQGWRCQVIHIASHTLSRTDPLAAMSRALWILHVFLSGLLHITIFDTKFLYVTNS